MLSQANDLGQVTTFWELESPVHRVQTESFQEETMDHYKNAHLGKVSKFHKYFRTRNRKSGLLELGQEKTWKDFLWKPENGRK